MSRGPAARTGGFTLIEVVASLGITALVGLSVAGFLTTFIRAQRDSRSAGLLLAEAQAASVALTQAARGAYDADLSEDGSRVTLFYRDGATRTFLWDRSAKELRDGEGNLVSRDVTNFSVNKSYPAGGAQAYPRRATTDPGLARVLLGPIRLDLGLAGYTRQCNFSVALRGSPPS